MRRWRIQGVTWIRAVNDDSERGVMSPPPQGTDLVEWRGSIIEDAPLEKYLYKDVSKTGHSTKWLIQLNKCIICKTSLFLRVILVKCSVNGAINETLIYLGRHLPHTGRWHTCLNQGRFPSRHGRVVWGGLGGFGQSTHLHDDLCVSELIPVVLDEVLRGNTEFLVGVVTHWPNLHKTHV